MTTHTEQHALNMATIERFNRAAESLRGSIEGGETFLSDLTGERAQQYLAERVIEMRDNEKNLVGVVVEVQHTPWSIRVDTWNRWIRGQIPNVGGRMINLSPESCERIRARWQTYFDEQTISWGIPQVAKSNVADSPLESMHYEYITAGNAQEKEGYVEFDFDNGDGVGTVVRISGRRRLEYFQSMIAAALGDMSREELLRGD